MPYEEIGKLSGTKIADLILKNREGKIRIKPGYDGLYGQPTEEKIETLNYSPKQRGLADFF